MTRFSKITGILAALALALGCGDDGGGTTPPVPGDLTLSYAQSGRPLGAVLLTISGGSIEAVTAIPAGLAVASADQTAGVTRIVISGTLTPGDMLKITVPDVNASDAYIVRVDQAADVETFALLEPSLSVFTLHR